MWLYPCAPDAQHQEGAIEMTENPAYAAIPDYFNVTNAFWTVTVFVWSGFIKASIVMIILLVERLHISTWWWLIVYIGNEKKCSVCVDGEEIEQVQNIKYLGAILCADGTREEEIEHRVGAAARVIGAMRKEVLERRELKKVMKMRVHTVQWWYQPCSVAVRYISTMMKRHENRLVVATEVAYLRRVYSRSDEDWQSKECRCEGCNETRGGNRESEKGTKSMEEKLEQMKDCRLVRGRPRENG